MEIWNILDVVVHDAVLVKEFNAGEKRAEPFPRVRFGDLDGDEAGMVCPAGREPRECQFSAVRAAGKSEGSLHCDKSV